MTATESTCASVIKFTNGRAHFKSKADLMCYTTLSIDSLLSGGGGGGEYNVWDENFSFPLSHSFYLSHLLIIASLIPSRWTFKWWWHTGHLNVPSLIVTDGASIHLNANAHDRVWTFNDRRKEDQPSLLVPSH